MKREDVSETREASLSERARIEAQVWDAWAREAALDPGRVNLTDRLTPRSTISDRDKRGFPDPRDLWIDSGNAQYWAYEFLAPLEGKTVLQLGGSSTHAIRFVLAGARRAVTIDPSMETLRLGKAICSAHDAAVDQVRAMGERLPFADETFDAVYGGSVLHHCKVDDAGKEIRRVLKPEGRAAFVDSLVGNRLVEWTRQKMPYPGRGQAGVDYPLSYDDARRFVGSFDAGEFREFETLGILVELVRRLHGGAGRAAHRASEALDAGAADLFPRFLRSFSRVVAIRVSKSGL